MYSDFKSPRVRSWHDARAAFRCAGTMDFVPAATQRGKGERSVYSEYKVKYSYMDARRWARPRGLWIRGPLKIYDTTPETVAQESLARDLPALSLVRASVAVRRCRSI